MNDISNIMGNITVLLALVGGGLAAVAIAYAGIQWMTASGDPQKMAQVRMAVIGVVGGLVLVGVAFIIPRVVSQLVVEPAGGIAFDWDVGFNCDQVLRDQLVVQRAISDANRMNALIGQIQSQRDECSSDIWNPSATNVSHDRTSCFDIDPACRFDCWCPGSRLGLQWFPAPSVSRVPRYVFDPRRHPDGTRTTTSSSTGTPGGPLTTVDTFPSDSSKCWLYVSRTGVWSENY